MTLIVYTSQVVESKGKNMNLNININMDNDSFTEDPLFEVERILKQALRLVDFDVEIDIEESDMYLRDSNGNKVGTAELLKGE